MQRQGARGLGGKGGDRTAHRHRSDAEGEGGKKETGRRTATGQTREGKACDSATESDPETRSESTVLTGDVFKVVKRMQDTIDSLMKQIALSHATTPERTTSGTGPPWKNAGEDHRRLRVEREDDGTAESIEQAVTEGKPLRAVLKRWLQPRGIGFLRLVGYPNTADVFVHASTLPEDPTRMVGHTLLVQIQRDAVHSAKSLRATSVW